MVTERQRIAAEAALAQLVLAGDGLAILETLDHMLVSLNRVARTALGDCRDEEWNAVRAGADDARAALAPSLGALRMRGRHR